MQIEIDNDFIAWAKLVDKQCKLKSTDAEFTRYINNILKDYRRSWEHLMAGTPNQLD